MTDRELDPIDPVLAAAYAAERRVTADAIAAAPVARDQLLLAVIRRTSESGTRFAPGPSSPKRWRTVVATAVASVSIGYAAGRITAPATTRQIQPPAAIVNDVPLADRRLAEAPAAIAAPDAAIDAATIGAAIDAAIAASDGAVDRSRDRSAHPLGKDSGEGLLLDQARAALRRRLPDDARVALERHQRGFPDGQLREERDVLLVEVALAQNRLADANELIGAYLDRYPHGSLRGHIEQLQREVDRSITHGR